LSEPFLKTRIRLGRFGDLSEEELELRRCTGCGLVALPARAHPDQGWYQSGEYRAQVGEEADPDSFCRLHDPEQTARLALIGLERFRDKVVVDLGCGGGSFLDAVSGLAREIIAVEPDLSFRPGLVKRGYRVYPQAAEALAEQKGRIDLAVSFATLEHLAEPLAFLKEIRELLKPGGELFLTTPNLDDALLAALPEDYPAFFFRQAHLWYFNPSSLARALEKAGFSGVEIKGQQRFGLGNFLAWLKHRRPRGEAEYDFVTPAVDRVWRTELERTLRSDFLLARAASE
jgi:SAM-dependent methyltransferase